jgi:hypothetical protein
MATPTTRNRTEKMTRNQRIKHWQALITAIVADYKELDAACDAANAAGCLDPNGRLYSVTWRIFETMLDRVDSNGWIAWYIYDNQCGERAMKAGSTGKTKPIKTPLDLAKLIVKGEVDEV